MRNSPRAGRCKSGRWAGRCGALIESGRLVTLAPVGPAEVRAGDVVLVAWKGGFLLHLVHEVAGGRLLIGNNLGKVNGWADATAVLGKVVAVED